MTKENDKILILGIESSSDTCMVMLSREETVVGQISLNQKHIHSRRMALMVQQLMDHLQIDCSQLSLIALSAGPGSFTGLRIGYSLAKGIAHALNLPVVQIPTLDLWALQQGETDLPILSVIDAHREEIFCGWYRWINHRLEKINDYQLIRLDQLGRKVSETTLVVGGDVLRLQDRLKKYGGPMIVIPAPLRTSLEAWPLMQLANQKFLAGDLDSLEGMEPLYMRAFKGIL